MQYVEITIRGPGSGKPLAVELFDFFRERRKEVNVVISSREDQKSQSDPEWSKMGTLELRVELRESFT